MSLIYKPEKKIGFFGIFILSALILLNFIFIILAVMSSPIFLFFGIPIIILDFLIAPLIKHILNFHEFELHTDLIKIKNKKINWNEVKSISFQTGRPIYDRNFNSDFKFPALQKIYIMDKKNKEYSAVIDIDYWLKKNRKKNNMSKIKKFLFGMNKEHLIADWAEKR